jgi:hypothetical protein
MGNIVYAALVICAGVVCAFVLNSLYGRLQKRAQQTESKLDDILLLASGVPPLS